MCYCFSSDSDDHYIRHPREPIVNLFRKSKGAGSTHKISTLHSLSGFSSEEAQGSHEDDYEGNDEDDEFFTSVDYSNAEDNDMPVFRGLNLSDSIILRKNSSFKKKRDVLVRKSFSIENTKMNKNSNDVACQTNEEKSYTDSQKQKKTQAIKITISTNQQQQNSKGMIDIFILYHI